MTSRLLTSEEQQSVVKAFRDRIDQAKKERSVSIDNGSSVNTNKPIAQSSDQTQELPSAVHEVKRQTSNVDENEKVSIYLLLFSYDR